MRLFHPSPLLDWCRLLGLHRLGSHISLILREQGKDQADELASGQNECAFVLVLGHFIILAPIVGLVFQVVLAHQVRPFNQVVTQVDVAGFRQVGALPVLG